MVQRRGLLLPVTPLTPPRQGEVVLRQAVRFRTVGDITCGSVDDGKSTLIGRLLVDSRAVLQDQLAGAQRHGQTDLALFTDGLMAEREQGITIDVAHRYFSTARRKFIIGDTPGHEQYTRNMVTAASGADVAVLLVDATKLDWADAALSLLAQTRRHALLAHLLRVPALLFAVNKLDAVADPALAFRHIRAAIERFTQAAGSSWSTAGAALCWTVSWTFQGATGWWLPRPMAWRRRSRPPCQTQGSIALAARWPRLTRTGAHGALGGGKRQDLTPNSDPEQ